MVTQPLTGTQFEVIATNDVAADQKILNRFNQCIREYLESINFDSPGMMRFDLKSTGIQSYLNIVEQMMGISFRLSLTQYQLPSGDVTATQTLYDVHLVELDRPRNFVFSLEDTKLVLVKDDILALDCETNGGSQIQYIVRVTKSMTEQDVLTLLQSKWNNRDHDFSRECLNNFWISEQVFNILKSEGIIADIPSIRSWYIYDNGMTMFVSQNSKVCETRQLAAFQYKYRQGFM